MTDDRFRTVPKVLETPKLNDATATDAKMMQRANQKKLTELGELVYAGGGAELLKLVADARAGRRIEF